MGTGFVGKEIPDVQVPPVSVDPPTPQKTKFLKSSNKEEKSSGSVTADILRLSVAETVTSSAHTSMVVESHSRVNSTIEESPLSRAASSVFEMEYTSPLVISKVEETAEETKEVKNENVKTEKKMEDEDSELFSLPPKLPALERSSLFTFESLT